jgi:uncharacterized protein YbjQ (UPF0145 family)
VFVEVLWVKPKIDSTTARQMENSLSDRFKRVAGRFGSGLKSVIKGSILGISLGLLNKILNPIEALDEKIKSLLGHGQDTADLAERLGSSSGQVDQLRNVAESFHATPEQFKELLTKFAEGIEKAREELANPFEERTSQGLLLGQFAKETDMVKSFKAFMQFLQKTEAGDGKDLPLTAHAARLFQKATAEGKELSEEDRQALLASGEIRKMTGHEAAIAFQKEVFGSQQFGATRKFLAANFEERLKELGQPTEEKLNESYEKLSAMDAQKAILDVQNKTKDFLAATSKVNGDMIKAMAAAEAREAKEATERLDSYKNLKKGADAVADIQQGFSKLLDLISAGLGEFKRFTAFIPEATKSPLFKGIFKTFSKGE